jgi:hypothetical protein
MKMKGGGGGGRGGGYSDDGLDDQKRIEQFWGHGPTRVAEVSPTSIYTQVFNHMATGQPPRPAAHSTARSRVAGGGPGSRGRR